jgi:PAS domain S-box-containing protein
MEDSEQRPVEIILARGLMSNLATPAFLVDVGGTLVFFNDAAAKVLGVRFEEAGPMSAQQWGTRFSPLTEEGRPVPLDELPLLIALNEERPCYSRFSIRSANGDTRVIEVSAFPIVGSGGVRGAMAIFWDADGAG